MQINELTHTWNIAAWNDAPIPPLLLFWLILKIDIDI